MAYISFQPQDYFNTKLYSGSGSTTTLTGVGFQPDWTWIKRRNSSINHKIYDAVRTAGKSISSNNTAAEITNDAEGYLSAFTSDGFTVQAGTTSDEYVNQTGGTYVSWNWLPNGQGSSNTDGSINTTYTSANTTSGFSISTYTGTGSNATVGHGLGVAPKCFILKKTSDTSAWSMYHESVGNTKFLTLNGTGGATTGATVWNNTSPTSSVFSVGTGDNGNASGATYVAYCFAEKKGFSKFMGWSGNSSTDGTFLYTGFKPAFFIYKLSSSSGSHWCILDNKRDAINPVDKHLFANLSNAEASDHDVDFVSNGLKIRSSGGDINASGSSYIGIAFAEEPLVSSNGIPAVAR